MTDGCLLSQLQARGFLQVQGVDGSPEMLKQAEARGLYRHLSLCALGQEPLPNPEGTFRSAPPSPTAPRTASVLSSRHLHSRPV